MHVVWSTEGSRGNIESIAELAVPWRTLRVEVRVCVPPDRAEPLGRDSVSRVPTGEWR